MSHLKERKEKTCLNCHTNPLHGRYCHVCGQENLEPRETVWHLVQHFFNDITHFDGKFFATVKYLLKRPGFLSSEYRIGRRARYLNPIRMYVFTSAIFFIILFSLKSSELENTNFGQHQDSIKIDPELLKEGDLPEKKLNVSVKYDAGWDPAVYRSVNAYDSVQTALPEIGRDGWLKKLVMRRLIATNEAYQQDSRGYTRHLVENFLHSFPKILFLSLPFFALILRLLYVRRSQYLYVDHGIFTIHVYCATFIFMLALLLLGELSNRVHWGWLQTVSGLLIFLILLYIAIYLFLAMRAYYGQSWGKTFLKYCILCSLALMVNALFLLIALLLSAISI